MPTLHPVGTAVGTGEGRQERHRTAPPPHGGPHSCCGPAPHGCLWCGISRQLRRMSARYGQQRNRRLTSQTCDCANVPVTCMNLGDVNGFTFSQTWGWSLKGWSKEGLPVYNRDYGGLSILLYICMIEKVDIPAAPGPRVMCRRHQSRAVVGSCPWASRCVCSAAPSWWSHPNSAHPPGQPAALQAKHSGHVRQQSYT